MAKVFLNALTLVHDALFGGGSVLALRSVRAHLWLNAGNNSTFRTKWSRRPFAHDTFDLESNFPHRHFGFFGIRSSKDQINVQQMVQIFVSPFPKPFPCFLPLPCVHLFQIFLLPCVHLFHSNSAFLVPFLARKLNFPPLTCPRAYFCRSC